MTTNTTKAASIADDQELRKWIVIHAPSLQFNGEETFATLFTMLDAKLAQAREEGRRDSHETNVTMLNLKLKAEDRAAIAEDAWRAEKARADEAEEWLNTEKEFSHSMEQRAIAAESRAEKAEQYTQVALGIKDSLEARLAEIQRGVEGMSNPYMNGSRYFSLWEIHHKQFLALLQPQGQASDTSGLPDDQIIQRAGEIFGFKPHKQDEVNKQKFLDFARWVKEEV